MTCSTITARTDVLDIVGESFLFTHCVVLIDLEALPRTFEEKGGGLKPGDFGSNTIFLAYGRMGTDVRTLPNVTNLRVYKPTQSLREWGNGSMTLVAGAIAASHPKTAVCIVSPYYRALTSHFILKETALAKETTFYFASIEDLIYHLNVERS